MKIDTDKYQELIAASEEAVKQMEHSGRLITKLLMVCSPSEPLLGAIKRLRNAVNHIKEDMEHE